MRLNKYIAEAGICSRRAADTLIAEGKVSVNGKVARELGTDVDLEMDRVSVNGKRISLAHKTYYLLLHKPKGYVSTAKDEKGRKTVYDLIDLKARLFSVGRLDYDTEGALLLTNDGELANTLTHPKNEVEKTYVARISGQLTAQEAQKLRDGVSVDGKMTAPAKVTVLSGDEHRTRVEIVIHEGRNRQIKKMFAAVGKEVEFLKRTAIGEIRLGGLSRGKYRFLSEKEIAYLKTL